MKKDFSHQFQYLLVRADEEKIRFANGLFITGLLFWPPTLIAVLFFNYNHTVSAGSMVQNLLLLMIPFAMMLRASQLRERYLLKSLNVGGNRYHNLKEGYQKVEEILRRQNVTYQKAVNYLSSEKESTAGSSKESRLPLIAIAVLQAIILLMKISPISFKGNEQISQDNLSIILSILQLYITLMKLF